MTENFIDQVNKITEEIRNGGRENVERRFNESLRYFGVETMIPSNDDDWETEDGQSSSEGDLLSSKASPLRDHSFQDESETKEGFSKNAVAAWFKLS